MRFYQSTLLICCLWLVSVASDITLPSGTGFNFVSKDSFRFALNSPCSSPRDTFDFFWCYYDAVVGGNCPTIEIAIRSTRPFYYSKKPMNYSVFNGDTTKLADTTLFTKCTTNVLRTGLECLYSANLSSIVPGGVNSAGSQDPYSSRLFVFLSKSPYPRKYIPMPLRIDNITSRQVSNLLCQYTVFDSMAISYGNSVTQTKIEKPAASPVVRSIPHGALTTTVSGRIVHGMAVSRGVYIDINKKRVQTLIQK